MTSVLHILRSSPGQSTPPGFQTFEVEVEADGTVLDALETIRLHQDGTLMYRHSCHHSCCGTCACRINGTEGLLCLTRVRDVPDAPITLEPLRNFPVIGDLVVDMTAFYAHIRADWEYLKTLKPSEGEPADTAALLQRLEDCIECGCCVSACPVMLDNDQFMGPAALAALHTELLKHPEQADALLAEAAGEHGERWCDRAIACSRVCPTGVAPARHIAQLRTLIQQRKAT